MTESGLEVMAFHLHRFLAGWMEACKQERLLITLGFEGAYCESATFHIELHQARVVEVGWSFEDLCQTYRQGDGNLYLEGAERSEPVVLSTVPILDRPAMGGQARVAMGFVLLSKDSGVEAEQLVALQNRVFEAVCAARRNAMRLFFDEHRDQEIKGLLYDFMEHLPEWTGCDYASSMILTSSLETMTLDSSSQAHFNILAERLFGVEGSGGGRPERLVGMMVRMDEGEAQHVLAGAFHRQREDGDLPYQSFIKRSGRWISVETGEGYEAIHAVRGRQQGERMLVLTPLVAMDGDDRELLGFLSMTWGSEAELTSAAGDLLAEIGAHLGPILRHSSLYMLGAKKLWLLREMRAAAERLLVGEQEADESLVRGFIGEAAALLREHVAVPSFGIAHIRHDEKQGRTLRYEHPHGWTKNESIDLLVDVTQQERTEWGVSSLAVRLNRPLVLAGGYGEGDDFGFKNSLFVHEESGRLEDVRRGGLGASCAGGDWVALSDYYKPARKHAYATLAYPITFARGVLGVLTIEVDRETDWLWWTGFGGHLFWQLFASELASVFFALGVRAKLS